MAKPQTLIAPSPGLGYNRPRPVRTSLAWRLAAVVAVSMQIVAAICGVLLLFYWLAASAALSA